MSRNAENIAGQGFHTNPERINRRGKPPRLVTSIVRELKESGYERVSALQVVEVFEVLIGLPEEEIKRLVADKDTPMSVRIVGKAMLSAKGWEVLQAMFDRAHGKARQTIDQTNHNADFEGFKIVVVKGKKDAAGDTHN
jgi:hypothetical protein